MLVTEHAANTVFASAEYAKNPSCAPDSAKYGMNFPLGVEYTITN